MVNLYSERLRFELFMIAMIAMIVMYINLLKRCQRHSKAAPWGVCCAVYIQPKTEIV
jgi:hypothetical protein